MYGEWFRIYLTTRNLIIFQRKHANIAIFILFLGYFSLRWIMYMELKHALLRDWMSCKAILIGIKDGYTGEVRYVDKKAVRRSKAEL